MARASLNDHEVTRLLAKHNKNYKNHQILLGQNGGCILVSAQVFTHLDESLPNALHQDVPNVVKHG